jgi:hypothetical protein
MPSTPLLMSFLMIVLHFFLEESLISLNVSSSIIIPFILASIFLVDTLPTPYKLIEIEAGAREVVFLLEEAIIPEAIFFVSIFILSLLPGLFFAVYSIKVIRKIDKIRGGILSLGFFVFFIFGGIIETIGTGTCLTRIAIAIGIIIIYLSHLLPKLLGLRKT